MTVIVNEINNAKDVSAINQNFQVLEDYINQYVLNRAGDVSDGNQMNNPLDMNNQPILNIGIDEDSGANSLVSKSYVDQGDANTLQSANTYSDSVAASAEADAISTSRSYTDGRIGTRLEIGNGTQLYNMLTQGENIILENLGNTVKITAVNAGTVKSVNLKLPDVQGNVTITASDVGLGNVDNTADLDKPVSSATAAVLNTKQNKAPNDNKFYALQNGGLVEFTPGSGDTPYLGNWDASTNTPTISNATGTEGEWYICNVAGSQDLGSGTIAFNTLDIVMHVSGVYTVIGQFGGGSGGGIGEAPEDTLPYARKDADWVEINKSLLGLGNVDNTSDANKPVSTATANALALKQDRSPVDGTKYVLEDGALTPLPALGEVNDTASVGTGSPIRVSKVGATINQRSIKAQEGIEVTHDSQHIYIKNSAAAEDFEGTDIVLAIGSTNMLTALASSFDVNLHSEPELKQYAQDGTYLNQIVPYSIGPKWPTPAIADTAGAIPALFCKAWLRAIRYNRRVVVVPVATDGSKFDSSGWLSNGTLTQQAISATNSVIATDTNSRVVSILFQSGEEDAIAGTTTNEFINYATNMVNGIRSGINNSSLMNAAYRAAIPCVFGGMSQTWYTVDQARQDIQQALIDLPTYLIHSAYVSADDLAADVSDTKIFSVSSSATLGTRFFNAVPGAEVNDTVQPLPPLTIVEILSLGFLDHLLETDPEYLSFKSYVDDEIATPGSVYEFRPEHAMWVFYINGDTTYRDYAISSCDQMVAEEEALIASATRPKFASDSYLQDFKYSQTVSFCYQFGYDQLTALQRSRWEDYIEQGVWNIHNAASATWGGNPFPHSGEGLTNPGNNYYHSHLLATMCWALASKLPTKDTWIAKTEEMLDEIRDFQEGTGGEAGKPMLGGGSREGNGYALALVRLWHAFIYWKAGTGEDRAALNSHTRNTADWMLHAMAPDRAACMVFGDNSRTSYPFIWDYHLQNVNMVGTLSLGTDQARRAKWYRDNTVWSAYAQRPNRFGDLYEQEATELAPTALSYYTPTYGSLYSRSDWTTGATFIGTLCGLADENHSHMDQGAFNLWKGTDYKAATVNYRSRTGTLGQSDYHNTLRWQEDVMGKVWNGSQENPRIITRVLEPAGAGEVYTLQVDYSANPGAPEVFTYTTVGGDTAEIVASALATAINTASTIIEAVDDSGEGFFKIKKLSGISNVTLTNPTTNIEAKWAPFRRGLQAFPINNSMSVNYGVNGAFTATMDLRNSLWDVDTNIDSWSRVLEFNPTRVRTADNWASSTMEAVWQCNVLAQPVVQGDGYTIVAGDLTFTIINPANPDIHIVDWSTEDIDKWSIDANPVYATPGYKIEIHGSTVYDVVISLPGDAPPPSVTAPYISEGASSVPVDYQTFTIDLNNYVTVRSPQTINWASALIVTPPVAGTLDTTNLTTLGTVTYTVPAATAGNWFFEWTVENNLAEISNTGRYNLEATTANFPLVQEANEVVNLSIGNSYTLLQTDLEYTSLNNTPAEISYEITALNSNVEPRKLGTPMGVSDTFTQQEVNNGDITFFGVGSTPQYTLNLTVRDTGSPQNSETLVVSGEITSGNWFEDDFLVAADGNTTGPLVITQAYTPSALWTQRRDNNLVSNMTVDGNGAGFALSTSLGSQDNFVAPINKFHTGNYEIDYGTIDFSGSASTVTLRIGTITTEGHEAADWANSTGAGNARCLVIKPKSFEIDVRDNYASGNLFPRPRYDADGTSTNGVTMNKDLTLWADQVALRNYAEDGRWILRKYSDRIEIWIENTGKSLPLTLLAKWTNDVAGGQEFNSVNQRPYLLVQDTNGFAKLDKVISNPLV